MIDEVLSKLTRHKVLALKLSLNIPGIQKNHLKDLSEIVIK
jgi:hypothetical protein